MKLRTKKRQIAGITLIELLVVVVLMAILTVAVTSAFVAGLDLERRQKQRQTERQRSDQLELTITRLLQGAMITDDVDDTTTFFVASSVGGDTELGSDRLTFTTMALGVPLAARDSTDDFETQQEAQGPIGGVAEVALGTTAFGDSGNRTGLFQRVQRPSDGDPTQGGREWLIDPQIDRIGFQFYNGTDWIDAWDTVLGGERRLPTAVRVNYTLKDTPDEIRNFIVPIPTSDVDATNPSVMGGQLQ